jgi:hypothetical protein
LSALPQLDAQLHRSLTRRRAQQQLSFEPQQHTMSKRTIAATTTDSDTESQRAGPSAPKRARRSTSPFAEPQIRSNESSSEEEPDDDPSDDQASLDLDGLEEQIRTHIDATRAANTGRLGVRLDLMFCICLGINNLYVYPDRRPEGDNRVCRNV